ncbi:MAG: hypothetical protein QW403_03290, partial [Candidatus Aenigmatarchaeota archaeon]
ILMPARFYNIKFNSSKQYYNPSVVIGNNNFWIETAPTLTNPSVNNTQGGWGEWYTFSVNVTDEDRDDVRVWLWRRRVGSETWTQFGSPLTKPAGIVSQVLNFTRTFTCDDLNLGENQVWEFMFNATDDPTTYADDKTNSTTISLTLERDDISLIYVEGNNSVVNRSIAPSKSNATLRVQVIDTDRNLAVSSEPGTARFYVTTNPYDINSYTVDKTITVGTETGGYLTDIFPSSPRCNYKIGPLRWKVEFGSTCYKTTNSSVFFLNTTTYPLQVEIQRPNNETFRRATDTILLRGNVSDDCGLVSGAEVRIKTVKGVFSYGCPDDVGVNDEGNGWYNCSFISSLTWSLGYYNATMQASKEFYESSELKTKINASVLVTNPEIQGLSITTSDPVNPGGWGELWTFSAQVRDIDQGISELGFERLNISLWIDFGSGYQLVNSTICEAPTCSEWTEISFTQHNFNCQHIGTRAYKWNVSDVWSYRAEASDSVTVNPDDIEFPTSEIAEPVSIEREGLNQGIFVFRIKDKDNNSYVPANVNASIWFTTNASDPNSWDYTRYLTTNSSGYVTYNFDPNCSYSVGTQYWKGGSLDNCYEVKNMTPRTFEIKGQLKNQLTQPSFGSVYNVTQLIPINFTTLSDCSALRDDENPVINASSYTVELRSPLLIWESCLPVNNSYQGWYNCTWDSTNKKEGYWSIRLNSSKEYFNSNSTIYENWFWLENIYSIAENASVSPEEGGWTRAYNYTIDIYDQEGDTINCSLFISKDNQATWIYKGSYVIVGTPGIPTQGKCFVEVHDFSCDDIGTDNYFKWQIENGEPANAFNTSAIQGPNITESQVIISYIEGNDSYVNRSFGINQVKRFGVSVYDLENKSSAPFVSVSFWVTHDNSNYQLDIINQTDSFGNASYYFNPDCSYSTGKQYWIAGVTDSCYVDVNTTSNFTSYVIGDLIPTITSPKGEKYLRSDYPDGQVVPFNASVKDECELAIINAQVNFSGIKDSEVRWCYNVINLGDGNYICELDTSNFRAQEWNSSVNVSANFYNSNFSLETFVIWQKGFWVETKPILTTDWWYESRDYLGNLGDGSWGETWYFRVNATDEDYDTLEIKLWVNSSQVGGDWAQPLPVYMTNSSVQGKNVTVIFIIPGWPSYSNPGLGFHVFKFNVSEVKDIYNNATKDFVNNTYEIGNGNFTITKDDLLLIHVEGNNTSVHRPGNNYQTLSVKVFDRDKGSDVTSGILSTNVRIWVTNDLASNFTSIPSTFSSGYINTSALQFDPDCSFRVGPQKWKAGVLYADAYKATNSSDFFINITTDPLKVELLQPLDAKLYLKGIEDVPVKVKVTDECGGVSEANVTIISQQLGAYPPNKDCVEDQSPKGQIFYEGSGIYNCTFRADTTAQEEPTWLYGYTNVSVQAFKTYYNSSEVNFTINSYYLASKPEITLKTLYTDYGTSGWGENWHFPVDIEDKDYNAQLGSTINVYFWLNLTGSWQLFASKTCVPATGNCTNLEFYPVNFTCNRTYSDIGVKGYKVNASDNFGYKDEKEATFTIAQDQADIADVKYSKSIIAREFSDSAWFAALFVDTIRGLEITYENVSGRIYITTDNSNYLFNSSLLSQPNGYLNYTFDPNCSFSVGIQKWKINLEDSCYYTATSGDQEFTVVGQLKNFLVEPSYGSIIEIEVGKTANITSSIKGECGENVEGASVTHEARWPDLTFENIVPVEELGSGLYNSTWNLTFKKGGYYGFRINSSKEYYYPNSSLFADWVYLNNTPPLYSNPRVSPETEGWGSYFNFSLEVNDPQQDNVVCTLFTSTDNQQTWVERGSTIVYGGIGLCSINVTFECSDIGEDNWFKWQLDDGTNILNTSATQGPNITADDVIIYYIYGNETKVNRSDSSIGNIQLLVVGVNDTDKGEPANATVTFYVTKDGNTFLYESNTTNSSGIATYYFNPDCNYNPGLQK